MSCSPGASSPSPPGPGSTAVDSVRVRLADAAGWRHRRAVEGDLDGDGAPERVVLTADVEVRPDGVPLWEDGHRWAVIVEDGDTRTLAYGAFVPNGHAEAALVAGEAGRRHLLVLERTPQRSRRLLVAYDGPDRVRAIEVASHDVEQWLPSLLIRD